MFDRLLQYGAQSLVSFLDRFGHLKFGLAIVEVAAYQLPKGTILLQPRVLAKTEVIERTLLIGPNGPVSFQQAALAEDVGASTGAIRTWFSAFWGDFLAKLHLDDKSMMPTEPAKSTNQFFQMPPRGGLAWISAYVAQSARNGGVYLTFSKTYERGPEIFELLQSDRESIEREIGATLSWERTGDKVYIGVPTISFTDLNSPGDRQKVTDYLADMTERMIRALKPRLEAAGKGAS